MKNLLLIACLWLGLATCAYGQSQPSIVLRESDGSPSVTQPRIILVPNGSLAVSGKTATLTFTGSSAPTDATYITQTPNSSLSAEQAMSALATGILKNTTTTGVLSIAAAGTDYVAPGGALGTPSSGTLTNATGLPVGGVSGLGTGVATFLATPSSANLLAAVTDETGSGVAVFGTSPAITTSLTTGSTTFALLNTTATTVNFAGAATTLNIGASATTVLNFGGSTSAAELRFLEPSGSGTNYSAFKVGAQSANITYTLPPTVGAAGTVLTDAAGDGVLSWAAGGGGSTLPVADTQTLVKGSGDATKLLRFEVDGFTTGTTRVATWPDADITVARTDAAQTFTGIQTFSSAPTANPSGGTGSEAWGSGASTGTATRSTCFGNGCTIGNGADNSLGFGKDVSIANSSAIAFGRDSTTTASNQLVVGSVNTRIDNIFFGKGVTSTSATAITVNGTGGSGADNAAGATQISAGKSTGNAAPAIVSLQAGALATASSSTAQTLVDRLIVGASKVLTNNSATTVTNITVASNTVAAGILDYAVEVFNGTDLQVEEGSVSFHITNKGGTIANNVTNKFGNQQAATSGTLTVTWAISAANPGALSVNANSSLTPSTGYPRVTYHLKNLSQNAVAVQ